MFYQRHGKTDTVSSTMFMKLTIKVVAFFQGHPVYLVNYNSDRPKKSRWHLEREGEKKENTQHPFLQVG